MKNGGGGRGGDDELDYAFELEEVSGDESNKLDVSSSAPSAKRSRRTADKRVVTVPIKEAKGAGEGAPPPDSWTWRKYGQKPIKGSPFPRGYYRCSSSKGCPARKQVERSRLDPAMIVITYSFDHNHSAPLPRNHHHKNAAGGTLAVTQPVEESPSPPPPPHPNHSGTPDSSERDEKMCDLIAEEESAFMAHDAVEDFPWLGQACSTAARTTSPSSADSDELLYGSVFFAAAAALPEEERQEAAGGGEEDALFAGLGELPEYSVVLRRGLTSASWLGTAG